MFFLGTAHFSNAQTLLHYWNFNNNASEATITAPSQSIITGAGITVNAGTQSSVNFGNASGQDFDLLNLNAQNNDVSGTHLRFDTPIGGSLIFNIPTTGYNNIMVQFATRRSGSGAGNQLWSYTTDGTTYIPFTTIAPNNGAPALATLDFSDIAAADNNPLFKIKVEFEAGSGGAVGNNRFDNLTVKSSDGDQPAPPAAVSFAKNFVTVNENHGTLNFVLNVANPPASGSVNLVVRPAPFSTADASDFTLATQVINITESTPAEYTVSIPIIDDNIAEQHAEYFVLTLEDATGVDITGDAMATVYIKDNDIAVPVPSETITLDYVMSFDPSGNNNSTCEIVVHDPASQRLFTTSAVAGFLDIINFANPTAPVVINSINMNPYGGVTSVAVKNGIVAVASPNATEHLDGSVVFFDTNGTFIKQVTVGALPDNISFSPDGTKVLTANEGQPNSDYSIDPEGSVSIIDITGGVEALTQSNVTTLLFTAYNTAEAENALITSGVRKLKLTSTMSQDFEPEYITVSNDSKKAWVTLQENNAIAEINLENNTIADVWALGTKDVSLPGNGMDISDNNGEVLIANWPVKAYYIPDAVANFTVNGTNYLVTANEGDEKEYDGFEERTTIGASSYALNAQMYPQADMLKKPYNAGRLRVTNLNGNTDANADYEQIYALGSRSFSIFNADTKALVYDSGDDFEVYTAMTPYIKEIFNSDHEANGLKTRSRAKGPEPEGVTTATIAGKTFAFISLERIGGVMVYDVTNPESAEFVDYKNSRTISSYGGDHGPEGITFISAADSPDGKNYVIIANEISGTLSIFEVNAENLLGTDNTAQQAKTFVVFPNPSKKGIVYFNRPADITVYDISGKIIHTAANALSINTAAMATGIYLVKTADGVTKKLVIE